MANAIFYDLQRITTRHFYDLKDGVYEGRILKTSNDGNAYSVQLRNGYVINNVLGETGLEKYQNVTVITYGTGKNKASIIKAENTIQYNITSVRVV